MRCENAFHTNLQEARALAAVFVTFRNHYWFSEVTLKPQGRALYAKFQRGLEVLPLYESVGSGVKEILAHYEAKSTERTSSLMQFLFFIGLPTSVLFNLFGNAEFHGQKSWFGQATGFQFLEVAVAMYSLCGVTWFLWHRWK